MVKAKKAAAKKAALKKPAKVRKYVAVVMRKSTNYSNRPRKDWSCFVGETKESAVKRALAAAREWAQRYGEYDILVGELTEAVRIPVLFELENL